MKVIAFFASFLVVGFGVGLVASLIGGWKNRDFDNFQLHVLTCATTSLVGGYVGSMFFRSSAVEARNIAIAFIAAVICAGINLRFPKVMSGTTGEDSNF